MRSDSDLQRHIQVELFGCPHVDETDIAVKVTDGVVTLTGYVRDFLDKFCAEDVVKRIAGVVALANDIRIEPGGAERRSDPRIARAVVAAIKGVLPTSWQQVRPVIRQGSVTLEGALEQRDLRQLIERTVRGVPGVVCVVNAIALQPGLDRSSPRPNTPLLRPGATHAADCCGDRSAHQGRCGREGQGRR
jgi:osmotically-inducible protein OsmY